MLRSWSGHDNDWCWRCLQICWFPKDRHYCKGYRASGTREDYVWSIEWQNLGVVHPSIWSKGIFFAFPFNILFRCGINLVYFPMRCRQRCCIYRWTSLWIILKWWTWSVFVGATWVKITPLFLVLHIISSELKEVIVE